MIGLGRMGGNIVRRLMRNGHSCVVYDRSTDAVNGARRRRRDRQLRARRFRRQADRAESRVGHAAGRQDHPRHDRRAERSARQGRHPDRRRQLEVPRRHRARRMLEPKGITFVDVGTSGGVWGLERGYCMMIGGTKEAVDHLDPIFRHAGAGRRHDRKDPGPRGPRPAGRERLHPCRPCRRRAFRQDGP
jgi:6-phosphogluconate dehydrogenase